MINVTKLNRTPFMLNALMVERIEETPDTVVTLSSGKKVHVLETAEEVSERITAYYARINVMPLLQNQRGDE